MTMLTNWDYREVQWFDSLDALWQEIKSSDPDSLVHDYEDALKTQLDLPMCSMDTIESRFFKHHYRSNWHNQGVMMREIDVIRRQEGW
jgi:hypothetical protein